MEHKLKSKMGSLHRPIKRKENKVEVIEFFSRTPLHSSRDSLVAKIHIRDRQTTETW